MPLAVLAAGVLLLAGCGDDTSAAESPTTSAEPTSESAAPPSDEAEPTEGAGGAGGAGDCVNPDTDGSGPVPELTGEPKDLTFEAVIAAGGENPPTELKTADVVTGEGEAAKLTNTVKVAYTGAFYCDGEVFDSSWAQGEPVEFPLDGVVPGFAQGIEGMQPGGRREIVIPPELGYGDDGNPTIPGGSTLVFVVDLVEIS